MSDANMLTLFGDQPRAAAHEELPPSTFRWDVDAARDLLLRPEQLFPRLLAARGDRMPWLAIWFAGMALAIARIEQRSLTSSLPVELTWPVVWTMVVTLGVPMGLFAWVFFGWWFRVRLQLCGARDVPKRHARQIWVFSYLVSGVGVFGSLARSTLLFPDYMTAWNEDAASYFMITVFGLMLWSAFVGYRGAISLPGVKRTRARWWFLFLPLAVQLAMSTLLTVVALFKQ